MNKINGIIIEGKVYVAEKAKSITCLQCDLVEEDGGCVAPEQCFRLGSRNIFRYSQELTDKLKQHE